MPSVESLLVGPLGWPSVIDTQTNAIATATKAAVATLQHVVSGVSISASAAPAASVSVQLKDGTTVIDQWELPASAFAPIVIEFKRPFVITFGAAATLTSPALGAAVKCTLVLRGFSRG